MMEMLKKRRISSLSTVSKLPLDILKEIFVYFEQEEILGIECVSKQFRDAANLSSLWKTLDVKTFSQKSIENIDQYLQAVVLSKYPHIRNINLSKCRVKESTLHFIFANLYALHSIDVSFCKQMSDAVMSLIGSRNHGILVLRAAQCPQLTDEALLSLRQCNQLNEVSFNHCRQISSIGVRSLVQYGTIRLIGLKGCPKIGNDSLLDISKSCHEIESINIGGGGEILDSGLEGLGNNCKKLRILDISSSNPFRSNRRVTDDGMIKLLTQCTRISCLSITGYSMLSPSVLSAILEYCPGIRSLNLGGCKGITRHNEILGMSLSNLKSLEELSLWSCGTVTDDTVKVFARGCRHLTKVDLDGCKVTKASIDYIKSSRGSNCYIRGVEEPASIVA